MVWEACGYLNTGYFSATVDDYLKLDTAFLADDKENFKNLSQTLFIFNWKMLFLKITRIVH